MEIFHTYTLNSLTYVVIADDYEVTLSYLRKGLRFHLVASLLSGHTDELWYNETVYLRMTIYS